MGQTYRARFRNFSLDQNVTAWRLEQQGEWDRLSTSLALLATMNAAILTVADPPPLAFALWLGGAGLSISGLFIVQYFSIRAFPFTDEEIGDIVNDRSIHTGVLGTAVASPVIITLWVAILFGVGVADYLIQKDLKYRIIAGVPIALGFLFAIVTMIVGCLLGNNAAARRRNQTSRMRHEILPSTTVTSGSNTPAISPSLANDKQM